MFAIPPLFYNYNILYIKIELFSNKKKIIIFVTGRKKGDKMARIITDSVYAKLVAHLAENETVALFQQLLLSPKTSEEQTATENKEETQIVESGENE